MGKSYDVIIIGAGPGGLECARGFADKEMSVLVIERKDVVGPKTCGGALTDLTEKFNVPDEITEIFHAINLEINDIDFDLDLKKPIRTVSRPDLGQYQLNILRSSGNIEIITGTEVESVCEGKVFTRECEFSYKYLVGADGSDSVVRKFLRLESEYRTGLLYQIENIKGLFRWSVNPEKTGSGYMWMFPNKKGVNTGIYFDQDRISNSKAREILDEFVVASGLNINDSAIQHGKIQHKYSGISFGNIFLAGDAAGLPLKNTGEGIPGALISGREIAKKILNRNYDMPELKKYIKLKKRQEKLLKIFEAVPFLQSFFFKLYAVYKRLQVFCNGGKNVRKH
jgi:flavin-dependent dehydrogenase